MVEKFVDEGTTATLVTTSPLRYNTGVTAIASDGSADKEYVKTYSDELDLSVFALPSTNGGAFE